MDLALNYTGIVFALAMLAYAVNCYARATYLDKTRDSNYVDTWFCLAAACKLIELLVAFFGNMTNGGLLPFNIEYNQAYRGLLSYLKMLGTFFIFMMLLKAPKKVIFARTNKLVTLLAVVYNFTAPIVLIFFFAYRNPSLTVHAPINVNVEDIVGFPVTEVVLNVGFILYGVLGLVAFLCILCSHRKLFLREWAILITLTTLCFLLNVWTEHELLDADTKLGIYSAAWFAHGYLFARLGAFLRFDGLEARYRVGLI
jgi:hypothetical protein